MTAELNVLALAGILQAIQFLLMAVFVNRDLGTDYTMGPRDGEPTATLSPISGRLRRALANHFEALILFTLAVAVVTLGNQSTGLTSACAWIYLVARTLYIPAYAFSLKPWRSVVWAVGFFATFVMIFAALV